MIKDITPEQYRCAVSMGCPSVHISEDGKELEINGAFIRCSHAVIRGTDVEATIRISTDLVREALKAAGGSNA